MSWQIGAAENGIVAVAYLAIAWAIIAPLIRTDHVRQNRFSLMKGAALFEDLKEKQRQVLEINDEIVQGLVTAKLALELNQNDRSRLGPGDLGRSRPARIDPS